MATQRIRLVISGLPLGNLGVGQGAYTFRIIVGLLRREPDFSFRIAAPAHLQLPPEIPESIVYRISGHPTFGNALLDVVYWSQRILGVARTLSADTLFHSPGPIAGFGRARKTVVTVHDCLYRTFPDYLGRYQIRKWNLLATERYAAKSTLVFTQSDFAAHDLAAKTKIPQAKIRVLSPWVDESFLTPDTAKVEELRNRLNLPPSFWLYVGGYDQRKNVEFMLIAYADARRTSRLPPLVLAGRVPLNCAPVMCDVMGTLRALGLSDDEVLMPGFIAVADLPNLYRAASLLIYPSLMEGFGLPAAEAMAAGTPLLASNRSSLPELVRNQDCLFDPDDSESLRTKLTDAAEDELRFLSALPSNFTESFGINRYLDLLDEAANTP